MYNILSVNKVYGVESDKLITYVETIRNYDNNFDGCTNFKSLNFDNYNE